MLNAHIFSNNKIENVFYTAKNSTEKPKRLNSILNLSQ